MESTIAHFRHIDSGVSAHLLIGRDGRVIQFLPFDRIAFHAGKSWWESDTDLNRMSIGIELDNAGSLKETPNGWFREKIKIPADRVERATYWQWDTIPICAWTPVIMPHRHVGRSLAEMVEDIQKTKTSILRSALDSMYLSIHGRWSVSAKVHLDEMLVSRPGGWFVSRMVLYPQRVTSCR